MFGGPAAPPKKESGSLQRQRPQKALPKVHLTHVRKALAAPTADAATHRQTIPAIGRPSAKARPKGGGLFQLASPLQAADTSEWASVSPASVLPALGAAPPTIPDAPRGHRRLPSAGWVSAWEDPHADVPDVPKRDKYTYVAVFGTTKSRRSDVSKRTVTRVQPFSFLTDTRKARVARSVDIQDETTSSFQDEVVSSARALGPSSTEAPQEEEAAAVNVPDRPVSLACTDGEDDHDEWEPCSTAPIRAYLAPRPLSPEQRIPKQPAAVRQGGLLQDTSASAAALPLTEASPVYGAAAGPSADALQDLSEIFGNLRRRTGEVAGDFAEMAPAQDATSVDFAKTMADDSCAPVTLPFRLAAEAMTNSLDENWDGSGLHERPVARRVSFSDEHGLEPEVVHFDVEIALPRTLRVARRIYGGELRACLRRSSAVF